ncbi:MAG: hypothetical protein QME47_01800, partial [Candidatus Thermoplasmatota archaeon]|nr:hypothetical protein [Candidatus Thermoplasmatota archaeon]
MSRRDGISKKYLVASLIGAVLVLVVLAVILQAATTIEKGMTADAGLSAPVYIRASSGGVAVMNLTVTNGTSGALRVNFVNITFTNVTWFDKSNLSSLTAGTDSGVALYNDTNGNGVWDADEGLAEYTDIPTWTDVDSDGDGATDDWRVNFTNPGPSLMAEWNFIVVIRTSDSIKNGTQFNLSIQANQIGGTDEVDTYTTSPSADIWRDLTITADTIIPSVTNTAVKYNVTRVNALGQQYARRGDVLNLTCDVTDNLAGIEAVKINTTLINSTLGWATMTAGAGNEYYLEVKVDVAADGLFDLYINATDKALDFDVDSGTIGNHNTTECIRVRLDTEVANGTTKALTWDGHPWVKESGKYAIFGFNATADEEGYTLKYVNVTFTNVNGFTKEDLLALSTTSGDSGVGIYRDDGSTDDVLDGGDTSLTLTSITWDGLTCRMELSEAVLTNVTGLYQWFVVIQTNSTITEGDQFKATILPNDIVYSDGTKQPPEAVATATLTADVTTPTTPTMNPEPKYTKGDKNNVSCNDVSDDGSPTYYYFECNDTEDFGAPIKNSGWVDVPWHSFTDLKNNKTYWYRVRAKDAVGHVSAPSTGPPYNNSTQDYYWADYPNTVIAIGEPKHGTGPTYINNTTPFKFTSTDNVSGVWKIEWRVTNTSGDVTDWNVTILTTAPSTLSATTGDFTLAPYNLPDGHYNITFRTYDWAYSNVTGYTTIPSTPDDPNIELNETKWIYLDNTPPDVTAVEAQVTWVSPVGQNWTQGIWNNVTWTATDGTGAGIKAYNASIDNEHPFIEWISTGHDPATAWKQGSGSYNTLEDPEYWINWTVYWADDDDNNTGWCNWTDLVSGAKYRFNVTAMDELGQIGTYSYRFLEVNSTQDNDAPAIAEGYPLIGDPKYRATADDPYNVTTKPNEAWSAGTPITIKVIDKPDIAGDSLPITHSGINITWYNISWSDKPEGNYYESAIGVDTIAVDLTGYSEDTEYTIYYGARDNVTWNVTLGKFVIWIDDSEPDKDHSIGDPKYGSPANITNATPITISGSDKPDHCAGVYSVQYRYNYTEGGGSWSDWIVVNDTSTTFTFDDLDLTTNGLYQIEYHATDKLGNRTDTPGSFYVRLDTLSPTGNLAITGTPVYKDYFINSTTELTIWANNSAGVHLIWYIINTTYYERDIAGNDTNASITFTVPSTFAEVEHTIEYGARDTVGNNGTIGTKNIFLDNSPPALIEIKPQVDYHYGCQNWTRGLNNTVTFSANDAGSGLHAVPYWCQKGYDDAFSSSPENSGWIATNYQVWNTANSTCADGEKYYYRFRAR